MTTSPAAPAAPMPTAPASPSQAVAAADTPQAGSSTPATQAAPNLGSIEPAKITKTRVEKSHRDFERALDAFDKAFVALAEMAAGKAESTNPTVQRVVGSVKTLVTSNARGEICAVLDELEQVRRELVEL